MIDPPRSPSIHWALAMARACQCGRRLSVACVTLQLAPEDRRTILLSRCLRCDR